MQGRLVPTFVNSNNPLTGQKKNLCLCPSRGCLNKRIRPSVDRLSGRTSSFTGSIDDSVEVGAGVDEGFLTGLEVADLVLGGIPRANLLFVIILLCSEQRRIPGRSSARVRCSMPNIEIEPACRTRQNTRRQMRGSKRSRISISSDRSASLETTTCSLRVISYC